MRPGYSHPVVDATLLDLIHRHTQHLSGKMVVRFSC